MFEIHNYTETDIDMCLSYRDIITTSTEVTQGT